MNEKRCFITLLETDSKYSVRAILQAPIGIGVAEAEKKVADLKEIVNATQDSYSNEETTVEIVVRLLEEEGWTDCQYGSVDFCEYGEEDDEEEEE